MRESLEDLMYKYNVNYSEVYNLFHFEKQKLLNRKYGLVRGLFSNSHEYDEHTLNIIERYYRREVSKWK
jgi:hypothetical protein